MTHYKQQRGARRVPSAFYWLAGAAILTMALVVIAFPRPVVALPAYAQQTGFSCGRCHVNPGGGGALTAVGKKYMASGQSAGAAAVESPTPWAAPRVCYGWCPDRDK